MKLNPILPKLAAALFLAEWVLVLLSWILSVVMPEMQLRSLLGGEGLRWLIGNHTRLMASPILVYILLLSIACGCIKESGLSYALFHPKSLSYRETLALKYITIFFCIIVAVILILTVVPHAVLLGVDGSLYPSPFSEGAVSLLAIVICILSSLYGFVAGRFNSLETIYKASLRGIKSFAVLFLFYLLGAHFLHSVVYVLGL